jgi:hypothetical protein
MRFALNVGVTIHTKLDMWIFSSNIAGIIHDNISVATLLTLHMMTLH